MVIIFLAYVEIFYVLVAKRKPQNSMLKHIIAKQIMSVPLVFTNIRIKVVGKENLPKDPGFSIYANHTSMMDIPVLMYKLNEYPVAFLAKQVVGDLFSIGKWTPKLGCVMIDREDARKGAESIIKVIKNVKSGSTMVIFPEGTRTNVPGELIDFKAGSFKVALKSKAPLVPITIVKPSNFKKIKWPFPKRITLVIHESLQYEDFKDMTSNDLSSKIKNIIESSLI
jgi:1-acyl-sn-glycerol-3-phosphate acyltransferase